MGYFRKKVGIFFQKHYELFRERCLPFFEDFTINYIIKAESLKPV